MRLTKIYTRQGDGGETRLATGEKVPKNHAVVKAMGRLVKVPIQERESVYQELYQTLSDLADEGAEGDYLGLNLLRAWAQARAQRRSIAECLSEQ